MKRMDDLIQAVTDRFATDAGLQREIAQELRARLWHAAIILGACAGTFLTALTILQVWAAGNGMIGRLGESRGWSIVVFAVGLAMTESVIRLTLPTPSPATLSWIMQLERSAFYAVSLCTAFLPVIILSEQCGLGSAFAKFGTFFWRHLWRYVTFIVLGALLLAAPELLLRALFGRSEVPVATLLDIQAALGAVRLAIQLVLTVMCFEFYLTKAGTAGIAPEKALAQA